MDTVSKSVRSHIMGNVRARGNRSTERRFRSALIASGIRGWNVQPKHIPGNPDFAFPSEKVAVFVDSCFWHGCKAHLRLPKSNLEYWQPKIEGNRKRDARHNRVLKSLGWKVFRVWEHQLGHTAKVVMKLRTVLRQRADD